MVCAGDYYHKKQLSPRVLDFGTKWAVKFGDSGNFTMLRGNHPAISSETSGVEYLTHLGINVCDNLAMGGIYVGHQMTEKSNMAYGLKIPEVSRFEILTKDLKKYDLSILGHQHQYQKISEKIYHLGSVRYTGFGEVKDKAKYIVRINDDREPHFIELATPYKMKDVSSIKELKAIKNSETHVRLVIGSFQQFKEEVNEIEEYKNKFTNFKVKLNFETPKLEKGKEGKSFDELVKKWIRGIKDDDIREILEKEFKGAD